MKIMQELPSLLNAPSTDLDNLGKQTEKSESSQPTDFMNYLSSLLFNQTPSDNAPSVEGEKLQALSQDTANATTEEDNNEALNNLLIEMNYLMNNNLQASPMKPDDKLSGAATAALSLETAQTMLNKSVSNDINKTKESLPTNQNNTVTTEMVRLLTGDANTATPEAANVLKQKMILNTSKEVDEAKSVIENVMTKAVSTKPSVDHTKLAKSTAGAQDKQYVDSLQNLSQWLQAKLNDKQVTNAMKFEPKMNELSVMGSGAASAPAKSAYEVSASIEKSMSAADVNLTTYHANIKIYPPELGKITARLKLDKNSAELEVVAENKQVKALLETHIVALKEQFSNSNIQLDKINIVLQSPGSDLSSTGKEKQQEKQAFTANDPDVKAENTPKKTGTTQKRQSNSNVDAYV